MTLQCASAGDGWVAVASDRRLLRLFMVGGLQLDVLSIPGPIFTLVGRGSSFSVVYHSAVGW